MRVENFISMKYKGEGMKKKKIYAETKNMVGRVKIK